jgi:hypothetical protein
MNERMKMRCAGVWCGLGANPVQSGLLHECRCLAPARGEAAGPACSFSGNIVASQNRVLKPILVVKCTHLCKPRSPVNPSSQPFWTFAAAVTTSRPGRQGQRDCASCASSGMTDSTDAFPNRNAARNLDAPFLGSKLEINKRMKIAHLIGGCPRRPTPAGNSYQLTRPAAVFCQMLQFRP